MLAKEMILAQYAYNNWANEKIFEKAQLVDETLLKAPSAVEGRSLYEILLHLVEVEAVWRMLVQSGQIDNSQRATEESTATADDLAAFRSQESTRLGEYLHGLSEATLAEETTLTRWDGVEMTFMRYKLLLHLFLHSMQHRSEAAVLLTQYGQSPGDIDALFFFSG